MKLKLKSRPERRKTMNLIFTDVDGTRYYSDTKGDIYAGDGWQLVGLAEAANIRALCDK